MQHVEAKPMKMTTTVSLSRRAFLRASGVSLALPFLDAMMPRLWAGEASKQSKRMICICTALGMHGPLFFPTGTGRDYKESPYLEALKEHRNDYTVFSGFAHPGNEAAGHAAERTFLTASRYPEQPGFRNSVSLDQFVADKLGATTRFPSLILGTSGNNISVNRSGVNLPADTKPSKVFAKLFLEGSKEEIKREESRLDEGRSVLDAVSEQAKRLSKKVGAGDRNKLDEYFTSVREMEGRLQAMQEWSRKPKPKVSAAMPHDVENAADMIGKMDLLFDLMPLALQTDSTRVATIYISGDDYVLPIPGVTMGHHALSHHGQEPEKIGQLRRVEEAMMKSIGGLIAKLKRTQEGGTAVLSNTSILFGSSLGNASNHNTSQLPILLAGGGFKHGQHLVVAPKGDLKNSSPLSNLFVSMLQRMNIETDTFGTSTGTVTGLDAV
jgi:hypothetical protein